MPALVRTSFIAFVLSILCIPLLIPALRRLDIGQQVREDGPASHLGKAGTPTMGGFVFILVIPLTMFFTGAASGKSMWAVLMILALGVIGILDDYLKISKRNSDGLSSKQKMLGQILSGLVFATYLWWADGGRIWIPFIEKYLDMGLFFIPFAGFVVVATVNGVNFTDGIDGLCAGVTFIVGITFLLLCDAWDLTGIGWLAGALAGSCLGFLCFNLNPAKLFMGDTGSLALGGAVAALALLSRTAMLLPLLGLIYVVEVVSVIVQRLYFRYTGGRRIFRMSPIHHHFELCGWSENRIDMVFWFITAAAASVFLWILI